MKLFGEQIMKEMEEADVDQLFTEKITTEVLMEKPPMHPSSVFTNMQTSLDLQAANAMPGMS